MAVCVCMFLLMISVVSGLVMRVRFVVVGKLISVIRFVVWLVSLCVVLMFWVLNVFRVIG